MMKTLVRLGRALAVVVSVLGAASVAVAEEEAPSAVAAEEAPSADAVMAEARALLDARRFDEALALLRPLTTTDQVYADAVFLFGLAAIETSRLRSEEAEREALLDEAIAALHTMLTVRPELARVRLELARAFFYKEEDGLARRHFERVLAGCLEPGEGIGPGHRSAPGSHRHCAAAANLPAPARKSGISAPARRPGAIAANRGAHGGTSGPGLGGAGCGAHSAPPLVPPHPFRLLTASRSAVNCRADSRGRPGRTRGTSRTGRRRSGSPPR